MFSRFNRWLCGKLTGHTWRDEGEFARCAGCTAVKSWREIQSSAPDTPELLARNAREAEARREQERRWRAETLPARAALRQSRGERMRERFSSDYPTIMSQPVIVPDSSTADPCSGGKSSGNSCSGSSSCSSSSSCSGGSSCGGCS